MSGWIKIHRNIVNHWLYTEKRVYSKFEAWTDILLTVNYTDGKSIIKGNLYEVKRGQSILSLESWSKRWNWDKSKVRRFLKTLQDDQMIVIKSDTVTTRLTVCNYDSYQSEKTISETQTKHKRNADETQTTLIEERKKERKKEINNNILSNIIIEKLDFSKFDNLQIVEIWNDWIEYKKNQFKKTYATKKSEQIALNDLCKISKGKTEIARSIVQKSIASLYQGLFELKENNQQTIKPKYDDQFRKEDGSIDHDAKRKAFVDRVLGRDKQENDVEKFNNFEDIGFLDVSTE